MGHDQDMVERLTEAAVEARAALRDLYAGIKEARKVLKDMDGAVEKLVKEDVEAVIQEQVHTQLEEIGKATKRAMDDSVAKVQREFDKLTNIMMTGDTKGKADDGLDLRNLIERHKTGP